MTLMIAATLCDARAGCSDGSDAMHGNLLLMCSRNGDFCAQNQQGEGSRQNTSHLHIKLTSICFPKVNYELDALKLAPDMAGPAGSLSSGSHSRLTSPDIPSMGVDQRFTDAMR